MTQPPEAERFAAVVRAGNTIYLGCRFVHGGGDIEHQTAAVFEALVVALKSAGATMADLVNLRTYYVYRGVDGPAVTRYWNDMTAVRLRYLADPGPAATALRVLGVPGAEQLIGVDGIATLGTDRQRLMPEHSWDWTIPTPFSQGWRVGDKVFVGGQLAADRNGKALAESDVAAQTAITLEYIRHVLLAGGHDWSDVAALRIGFKHDDGPLGALRLAQILLAVKQTLPEPRPALTAIGVDLLYEGLLLEIDAVARRAAKRAITAAAGWTGLDGFPAAVQCGDELHIGGLCAPECASFEAQVETTFRRLAEIIEASDCQLASLVKITMFHVESPAAGSRERQLILGITARCLPHPGPVVTLVSVPSLPHPGQCFQLDGVATRADRA